MYLPSVDAPQIPQSGFPSGSNSFGSVPGLTLLLSLLTSARKLPSYTHIESTPSDNSITDIPFGNDPDWIIHNVEKRSLSHTSGLRCRHLGTRNMTIRIKDSPQYLQVENATLAVGPIGENRTGCFKMHRFQVASAGLDGEVIVIGTSDDGAFINANATFGVGLQIGDRVNIMSVGKTDRRFFTISRREGERYVAIKSLENGMFISASPSSPSSSSSSSSSSSRSLTVSLVNQRTHSTDFEMIPCQQ